MSAYLGHNNDWQGSSAASCPGYLQPGVIGSITMYELM